MKVFEKYTEPAKERTRLASRTCDLCGTQAKNELTREWETSCYEIAETEIKVEIRQKEGSNYPEGGWGTEYEIDLCPVCFKEKLIPWLLSQGAKIEKKEWDW